MNKGKYILKKGTTTLTARPFTYVLNSKFNNHLCDHCLRRGKVSKCSACQCVYYCNHSCQRGAWPIHTTECPKLKKFLSKTVPDLAQFMTRVIIKLNQGGGEKKGYYSETNYRKFKDLMSLFVLFDSIDADFIISSNCSVIMKNTKRMFIFMCQCGILNVLFEGEPMPSHQELIPICGRICILFLEIYYGQVHPLTGMLYFFTGTIQSHLKKPKQALETLKRAESILAITNGEKHTLFRELFQTFTK
ncbi:Histone-lysine N-methyltransferase ASHR1 [Dufourea novaeangliae]|uniref:Histone-lysine N-methyltransferase ASHR1 n=1 Tax=Dufourea novaeangliae TaxID=178035 RepID=A0A154PR14_DUFNO|nr:Histone-lysine N-methyltransferase ASHR1 [Dufourea novaeangliae]